MLSARSVMSFAVAAVVTLPTAAAAQQVTFTKDVAPILQRSCVTCHRPGEMAPMSLMTYEEVRPWARAIKTRTTSARDAAVAHRQDIGIQKFKDDPSLTDEEIAKIAKWVDTGAPRGNPADMPALRQFAEHSEWQIGKPDIVINFPKYKVPAAGPDLFGNLYADIPIAEGSLHQGDPDACRRPSVAQGRAPRAVLCRRRSDNEVSGDDSQGVDGGQFLVEYASGKNAEVYPEGSGVLLKAGKKAMVSYHLHSIGEEIDAEIELGIKLYPEGLRAEAHPLVAAARAADHADSTSRPAPWRESTATRSSTSRRASSRSSRTCTSAANAAVSRVDLSDVGHRRTTTEVINCANFNYNWHLTYNYADDAQPLVPAGTILHTITWHDNS